MTKDNLLKLVGKNVHIYLKDGTHLYGLLRYVDEFSEKYDFCKPNYFCIDNVSFKASHVGRLPRISDID